MFEMTPQPHLQPPDYFARPSAAPGLVVRTRPRAEKKLAVILERRGTPYYLPTRLTRRFYGGRKRESWVPLFPGYVFLLEPAPVRAEIHRSGAALDLIPVPRPGELFDDLQSIWSALSHHPAEVQEARFRPGRAVVVVSGPLQGTRGALLRRAHGHDRLLIRIRLFERCITLDIDAAHVRPQ